jgi:ABC-type polar amino acid transport system ATPase subunit
MSTPTGIEVKEMNLFYGDFHALKDIKFFLEAGERAVVCGSSGSGKSSMIGINFNSNYKLEQENQL